MSRRIALISEHASPLTAIGNVDSGGQNVYVGQIAKHLACQGHEVDIFTRRDDSRLPEILHWIHGIRVIHVPAGPARFVRKEDMLPLMAEFNNYVLAFCDGQQRPYDVVHGNFFMSGLTAMSMKQIYGIPFVMTFHALGRVRRQHQGNADQFPDERFAIEDAIIRESDCIIAECPQDRDDLIKLYGANADKVKIVPCGFDPQEFQPLDRRSAREKIGFAGDAFLILQLGRLVPRKGIETVIRALALLRWNHAVAAHLVIVGGDHEQPDPAATPEIGRLQAVAAELGVADWVHFTGRRGREALRYYYNAADVFVTTPWYEPFGITPLEAMACGVPVVGSAVGGIRHSVRDRKTGFLVMPHDTAALSERLAYLSQHPEAREVLGQAGRRRVNRLFTWRRVSDLLDAIYGQVTAVPVSRKYPCVAGPQHVVGNKTDRTGSAAAIS
jgi:D-inositol-3-phosphate glycosyltransferase